MQQECHTLHPGTSSLSFSLPERSAICLACSLARLSNENMIQTVRRAAAHELYALCNAPQELLNFGVHHTGRLLQAILETYFKTDPNRDAHLISDVCVTICDLTISFDAALVDDHVSYPHLEQVLSECVACVLEGSTRGKRLLAVECIASLLRTARNHEAIRHIPLLSALGVAVERRAATSPIAHGLLTLLPSEARVYTSVSSVLSPVLAVACPTAVDPEKLLGHIAAVVPHRSLPEADRMVLSVLEQIFSRTVQVGVLADEPAWNLQKVALFVSGNAVIVEIMKRSVLSEVVELRAIVARVICCICRASQKAADALCDGGVFDYAIESIRAMNLKEGPPSSEQTAKVSFAIESAAAIVEEGPVGLSAKWCYSLDVILSVCEYVSEERPASRVSKMLDHAFRHAPVPVFSDTLISQCVAFEMTACFRIHQKLQNRQTSEAASAEEHEGGQFRSILEEGLVFLATFLRRYRPSPSALHSLLRLCESAAQADTPVLSAVPVLICIVSRFKDLAKGEGEGVKPSANEVQVLGQRLLFVTFDSWARAFEGGAASGIFSNGDQNAGTLIMAVDLFGSSLDHIFVESGCCSEEDQRGMRIWCWKFIPPRVVFPLSSKQDTASYDGDELSSTQDQTSVVVWQYLNGISLGLTSGTLLDGVGSLHIMQSSFLDSLAVYDSESAMALRLLNSAVLFDTLDSLCEPELVVKSLIQRLHHAHSKGGEACLKHCLDVVRNVSHICYKHDLRFNVTDVPQSVLLEVLNLDDFSFMKELGFNLFVHIVTSGIQNAATTWAWDRFVTAMQTLHAQSSGCIVMQPEKMLWTLLTETEDAPRSALFALTNTRNSFEMVDELLKIAETANGSGKLIKEFEKVGAADVLAEMLRATCARVRAPSGETRVESDALECQRSSSLLLLLSQEGSSSLVHWPLLRLVCETFISRTQGVPDDAGVWLLLSHLVRWLTVCLNGRSEAGVVSFVLQSGLVCHLIRLLRETAGRSSFESHYISTAAGFVITLLSRDVASREDEAWSHQLSQLAGDRSLWERLLNAFSATADRDWAYKATNCCCLLECLLCTSGLQERVLDTVCTNEITTSLSTAAFCSNRFLEKAALRVLVVSMTLATSKDCMLRYSSTHLQLSIQVFTKISSQTAALHELEYAEVAVRRGHLDTYLQCSEEAVRRWIERQQDDHQGNNGGGEQCADMRPTLEKLLSAIAGRNTAADAHIPLSCNISGIDRNSEVRATSLAVLEKRNPKFLLGRNFIVFTC